MVYKGILKYWLFSKPWKRGTSALSLGSWSPIKREFCRKYRLIPIHRSEGQRAPARSIVLVSEEGKKWIREAAERFHSLGSTIVGFEHGNTFGMRFIPDWKNRRCHLDKFVLWSEGSIQNFKESCSEVEYESLDSGYYDQMWHRFQTKNTRVINLMVMNFPMIRERIKSDPHIPGHDTITHFNLEECICEILARNGFHVTRKMHPATTRQGSFMNAMTGVKIENRRYEKVWMNADCLVFPHMESTTFGLALMTNKPIVMFDIEGRLWIQRAKDLLDKRVRAVKCRFEYGRIKFKEDDLLEAVSEPWGERERNTQFVETFAGVKP